MRRRGEEEEEIRPKVKQSEERKMRGGRQRETTVSGWLGGRSQRSSSPWESWRQSNSR